MEDKLTPQQRAANLERVSEYLRTLAPSLKLSHPASYVVRHFIETGHVFGKGCCIRAKSEDKRPLYLRVGEYTVRQSDSDLI